MRPKFAVDLLADWLLEVPEPRRILEEECEADPVPGVYVLRTNGGGIVYVGQSNDCARRVWRQHVKDKSFDYVEVYHMSDDSSRLRLEGALILALAPDLNRGLHLGFKKSKCWEIKWSSKTRATGAKRRRRSS